jgi:hypothetical protein
VLLNIKYLIQLIEEVQQIFTEMMEARDAIRRPVCIQEIDI